MSNQENNTTSLETQNSASFPPGYGDLIIQTADMVVFHFPSFLLGHVSPIFKDMFVIGEPQNGRERVVAITEDSKVWDEFLSHIDPSRKTPTFNPDTVSGVMIAAQKYCVESILEWFEREVFVEIRSNTNNSTAPIVEYPLVVLAIALHHNFDSIARHAIRELLKCDLMKLLESDVVIDIQLFRLILLGREARAKALRGVFSGICGTIGMWMHNGIDNCVKCSGDRDRWFCNTTHAIQIEPSWVSLERSSEAFRSSRHVHANRTTELTTKIDKWMLENEKKFIMVEAALPDLEFPKSTHQLISD